MMIFVFNLKIVTIAMYFVKEFCMKREKEIRERPT